MSKYSKQFKLKVVKEFLKSGGLKRVGHLFKISHSDVRKWTLAYQAHGHSGLNPSFQRYSPVFKVQVLQHMAAHQISARPAAAHFGIGSMTTILQWQKLYNGGGITALANRPRGRSPMPHFNIKALLKKPISELTPAELRRRMEYAEAESAYLKKFRSLSSEQSSKREQAQVITELRQHYPLSDLLIIAKMAKSVYYYWREASSKADPYQDTKEHITQIFNANQGRYGYRRVHLELCNQHQHLNHKTVQKLMTQLGLKSTVRPKRYRSYKDTIGKVAPNLLERNFGASKPNQKWVTDVTEFNIKGERVYLSPILDLYNQEIISYEIADRPQISSVMQMLQSAFKQLGPKDKPMLHSDQGWQYQMGLYQQALHQQGITQSMSRKGNCLDNAVMENWFGIMKTEFFYQKKFETIESFKAGLEEYIHYYNHDRIKQKLKGLSPVQYRTQSLVLT
ncbi:IS3 family transposase [Polynucleobacter sp. UK-Gri1-W3]|uniref:IS3 family transposase n=1 Tax=Polynucleobacter sp. UK-Gri1-W3 TaxID=1819737 RepID=UPI00351D89EF